MQKLKAVWQLITSKAYIVITDDGAVLNIPVMDPSRMDNILIAAAQQASLTQFHDELGEALSLYETKIENMVGRKGSKLYAKKGKGRS